MIFIDGCSMAEGARQIHMDVLTTAVPSLQTLDLSYMIAQQFSATERLPQRPALIPAHNNLKKLTTPERRRGGGLHG